MLDDFKFCPRCGGKLIEGERFGRLRRVCPECKWIHFADPKVAAAVLVEKNDQVLLVRRVMEPMRGLWSLPAGFIDAGEDPAEAAVRECYEESGLRVEVTELVDVLFGQEHPRGAHILIVYRARILGGSLLAGDDVDQAAFFFRDRLPPLAFQTTVKILAS